MTRAISSCGSPASESRFKWSGRSKNLSCFLATSQLRDPIANSLSTPDKWVRPNLRSGHCRRPDGVDVDGHFDRVRSATEDNAIYEAHVSVVAADTNRHVLN